MKKGIIIGFILGILVSGVVVYASTLLKASDISYNDTTVKDSLDSLFTDSLTGKNNIISTLSNKGFNVTNNSTYNEIIDSINELPITLTKDEEGNYGYKKNGEDKIYLFNNTYGPMTIKAQDSGLYGWENNATYPQKRTVSTSYTIKKDCNCLAITTVSSLVGYMNDFSGKIFKNGKIWKSSSSIYYTDSSNYFAYGTCTAGDVISVSAYGYTTGSYGGVNAVILTDEDI